MSVAVQVTVCTPTGKPPEFPEKLIPDADGVAVKLLSTLSVTVAVPKFTVVVALVASIEISPGASTTGSSVSVGVP